MRTFSYAGIALISVFSAACSANTAKEAIECSNLRLEGPGAAIAVHEIATQWDAVEKIKSCEIESEPRSFLLEVLQGDAAAAKAKLSDEADGPHSTFVSKKYLGLEYLYQTRQLAELCGELNSIARSRSLTTVELEFADLCAFHGLADDEFAKHYPDLVESAETEGLVSVYEAELAKLVDSAEYTKARRQLQNDRVTLGEASKRYWQIRIDYYSSGERFREAGTEFFCERNQCPVRLVEAYLSFGDGEVRTKTREYLAERVQSESLTFPVALELANVAWNLQEETLFTILYDWVLSYSDVDKGVLEYVDYNLLMLKIAQSQRDSSSERFFEARLNEIAPNNIDYLQTMVVNHLAEERWGAAQFYLDRLVSKFPDNLWVSAVDAYLDYANNRIDLAMRKKKQIIERYRFIDPAIMAWLEPIQES